MKEGRMIRVVLLAGLMCVVCSAQSVSSGYRNPQPIKTLDLTGPFQTRSEWHLAVTEGPPTKDFGDNDAPGALRLCMHKGVDGPCISGPVTPPVRTTTPDDPIAWEPHYLRTAEIVYPHSRNGKPLLLVVTGSLNSGDGDQIVFTELVAYDASADSFHRIFGQSTGHNNNQEIRFIAKGPLRGSVISAEPQEHLPYGYWIVVRSLSAAGEYRQVLRYGSATRYSDGNSLAVIDSEMPEIQRRMGLWRPSDPLPIPSDKHCEKPTLRNHELWCN